MKKFSSHTEMNDKMLISLLINNDKDAFNYVVSNYHSLMISVARAIIGEAFAEEVVQEAWLSAIRSLPTFEQRCSLKTWLLQITSNGAKSRIRRENRQISLDDGWQSEPDDKFDSRGHRYDDVLPWDSDTPEAMLQNQQMQHIIETAFQQLPANQRAVLTLFDMEGYTMTEICNILNLSASNARVLLHRARTSLHHVIAQYQES